MATVPSAVRNLRITAANATTISIAWDPPASNGGSAITSYTVQYWQFYTDYTLGVYQTWQSTGVSPNATSHSNGTANGIPANALYQVGVLAANAIGYSPVAQTQGMAFLRAAASPTRSSFETNAVSDSVPVVTPPSAFGTVVRLNQATNFVFSQLTSQVGRTDPDVQNVDPALVTASDQPITRLALGTTDVVVAATDSEQLAGEIPIGSLASTRGVVAHTTGASSFTLSKTWVSDRSAQIYTMAVLNNLPIAYASGGQFFQPDGSIRRTLIWTYDVPAPIGVGPGDTFTTTVTIAF